MSTAKSSSDSTQPVEIYSGLNLSPAHAALLAESCISPDVAAERRYQTVTTPDELRAIGFKNARQVKLTGLAIPIYNTAGQLAYHRLRPDNPHSDPYRNGRKAKYETPAGTKTQLDVPRSCQSRLMDASARLYITEGERKADAIASLGMCVIGISGVWMWKCKKKMLPCWDLVRIEGRNVGVVFDSDIVSNDDVKTAAIELRRELLARGAADVAILIIPPSRTGEKQGIDDFLFAGGNIDDLARHDVTDADRRPTIRYDVANLAKHIDRAIAEFARHPSAFTTDVGLVRLVPHPNATGGPSVRLVPLDRSGIADMLSEMCIWVSARSGVGAPIACPKPVIDGLLARKSWPEVRLIERIVPHPIVDEDGTIIDQRGYNAKYRAYICPSISLGKIDANPSRADAANALATLNDLFRRVRFASDRDRSIPVYLLLTLLSLPNGMKPPAWVLSSPKPGSGKSSVCQICHAIAYGYVCAPVAFTNDPEELTKLLTALVVECSPVAFFDNLQNGTHIQCSIIDELLTSGLFRARILSTNTTCMVRTNMLLWFTGNNVSASEDTRRRTLSCRIEDSVEPSNSDEFNLAERVDQIPEALRVELLRCALIILVFGRRAMRGKPPIGRAMPSFQSWARLVRDPAMAAGVVDCCDPSDDLVIAYDPFPATLHLLARQVVRYSKSNGFLVNDVERFAEACKSLKEALEDAIEAEKPTRMQIGKFLSLVKDRRFEVEGIGEVSFKAFPRKGESKSTLWKLITHHPIGLSSSPQTKIRGEMGDLGEVKYPIREIEDESSEMCVCDEYGGEGNQVPHLPHVPHKADHGRPPDLVPQVDIAAAIIDEHPPRLEPPTTDDDEVMEYEGGRL